MVESGADRHEDEGLRQAYGLVSDTLAGAVRETIERHDPDPPREAVPKATPHEHEGVGARVGGHARDPGRRAVRKLTAIDDEVSGDEPPPGWSLAFLVLADWFDV